MLLSLKFAMPALLQNSILHPDLYRKTERLMGNRFEFTLVAENPKHAQAGMDVAIGEVRRIERLLTTFDENSQTCQVNDMAGIRPVRVDPEFFSLVERSLKISRLTQGAFDITYGSADKRFWNFDTTMTSLPDPAAARRGVRLINFRNVELDAHACTVYLREPGMRIGFGGIGKGYASERVRTLLQKEGYSSGIVNAAGDLAAWGHLPGGQPWTVGIADPVNPGTPFSTFSISNMAVATSGDYEKYATIQGKRYSHTIDPRTGLPVTGIRSVTIICPNAEIADALCTPVMIMGCEAGLHMVNQLDRVACILLDNHNFIHASCNVHTL